MNKKIIDLIKKRKKLIALLAASTLSISATGCSNSNNNTTNNETNGARIEETFAPTEKPIIIPTPTIAPTVTATTTQATVEKKESKVIPKNSIERSKKLKNSEDPLKEMHDIYRMVGEEFSSSNGKTYRKVRIPNDEEYTCGYLNMETFNEHIPCMTYDFIGPEYTLDNGETYCRISILDDNGYSNGYFNMNTLTEVIPCKTYTKIKNTKDDIFECTKPDGNIDSYNLSLKLK